MRIEINTNGEESVAALQNGLSSLHTNINSTIESLQNTRRKINNITGGIGNLSDAVNNIQARIRAEESKRDAVEVLFRETGSFISNTISTDLQVAEFVNVNQEKFFNTYTWLKPPVEKEKSWWEKFVDGWNSFWGNVGEVVSSIIEGIVEFVKEHAVELIVGAIAIVVGAAIIALTGGAAAAFFPALLAGLKVAAISAVVGGVLSSIIAFFSGGNILSAFGDGFASGFMWGGIFFAVNSAVSAIQTFKYMNADIPKTKFDNASKLQKKFSSHAKDFGIQGNWNSASGQAFQDAIQNHINSAPEIYRTLFRGQEVYAYINPKTSLLVYTDLEGSFISGWSLNAEQLLFHRMNGKLLYGGVFAKISEIINNITSRSFLGGIFGGFTAGKMK